MKFPKKALPGLILALVMFASMAFVEAPSQSDSTQLSLVSIKAVTVESTATGYRNYAALVESTKQYQQSNVINLALLMEVKNIGKSSSARLNSIADRELDVTIGSGSIDLSQAKSSYPVIVANVYEDFSYTTNGNISLPGHSSSTLTVLDISRISTYDSKDNTFTFGLIGQEKNSASFFDSASIAPSISGNRVKIAALKAKDGTEKITVNGQTYTVNVKAPDSLEYTAVVTGTVKKSGSGNMYAKLQTTAAEKFATNSNGVDVLTLKDKYTIYRTYVPAQDSKGPNDVINVTINGKRVAQVNPQAEDGKAGPLVTEEPSVTLTPTPKPSESASPSPSPSATPSESASPEPPVSATPEPSESATPDVSDTPAPSNSETPTENPTPEADQLSAKAQKPQYIRLSSSATASASPSPTPQTTTVPNVNWAGAVSKTKGEWTTSIVIYGSDGKTVIGQNGIVVYTIADTSGDPIVSVVSEYTYFDGDSGKSIALFAPASSGEARRIYNVGTRFYYSDDRSELKNSSTIVTALKYFGLDTGIGSTYKVMGGDFEKMGAEAKFTSTVSGTYNIVRPNPQPTDGSGVVVPTFSPGTTPTPTSKPSTGGSKDNDPDDGLVVNDTSDGPLVVPKTGDMSAPVAGALASTALTAMIGLAAILKRLRGIG